MAIVGLGLGTTGGLYRLVLLLHITCATVGFGALALTGLYRSRARDYGGDAELSMLEAHSYVNRAAEYLIYGALIFGLLAGLTSQNEWQFSQWWLSLSILLYMIELGLLHGVIRRAEREYASGAVRVNALGAEGRPAEGLGSEGRPAEVTELDRLEQRIAWAWGGFDILFFFILYLMVFTPGHARVG